MARDRDGGYALVAAVTAVAAFAYIAFQVLAAGRGEVDSVAGRTQHARLSAAADAGIMVAIHALADDDPAVRWSIDGSIHHADFDGVALAISVHDERGKAPLAGLGESQSRALFAGAGASGAQLDALVDEFRDWQKPVPQQSGAARTPDIETAPGLAPRHGPFRTVGELMGLKDMDGRLYDQIAPAVTTFFEQSGPFDPRYAEPLAIEAINAKAVRSHEETAAESGFPAERPTEEIVDDHLIGRTLTVDVTASDPGGARTHRMAIVELTGVQAQPYWIRYVE